MNEDEIRVVPSLLLSTFYTVAHAQISILAEYPLKQAYLYPEVAYIRSALYYIMEKSDETIDMK